MSAPDPFSSGELLEGEKLERQLDAEQHIVTEEVLVWRAAIAERQKRAEEEGTEF